MTVSGLGPEVTFAVKPAAGSTSVTRTSLLPEIPPLVAFTSAVPAASAVNRPFSSTVPIFVLLQVQVKVIPNISTPVSS